MQRSLNNEKTNQAIEAKYIIKAKNRLKNKILEESQTLREIQLT